MKQVSEYITPIVRKWTTRHGIVGDYNYAHLFTPQIPFVKSKGSLQPPFFGLDSEVPIILGMILGLQHALAMLAGVITPPIIISGVAGFTPDLQQYLVSTSLIVSAILSCIQITRFKLFKNYYLGTGLLSVVGTSFATITIVFKAIPILLQDHTPEEAYGAILGTACLCSLLEIGLSFLPAKVLQKIFPKIVTGPVVVCIAINLIQSGFENWVGGAGCVGKICPFPGAPKAAPWGSAQFIGLGFLVFVTIIFSEKWGSPIMKSCAVIVGLLVGCIVAAACGYFSSAGIKAAPVVTFIWVHRFPLSIYPSAILPMLLVYVVLMMEAIGDITASCDVSRVEVEGEQYESRIQGGVLADGFNGLLAGLCTIPPMSTYAQNNGVIALTKCANRTVGYWCCFWLFLMGIFAKFAAALVSIPNCVLGGMTTFLFTSVAVSGIRIISSIPFTRRDRFVLTGALLPGIGATLVPNWFQFFFTYSGHNEGLKGLLDAIELVMETGFAITGITGLILNLFLPQNMEDEGSLEEIDAEVASDEREDSGAPSWELQNVKSPEIKIHGRQV